MLCCLRTYQAPTMHSGSTSRLTVCNHVKEQIGNTANLDCTKHTKLQLHQFRRRLTDGQKIDRGPRGHHRYKTTATACLPKTKKQCCARHSTCNCYGVTVSSASRGKACDCPSSQLTNAGSVLAQAVCCLFGHSLDPTHCETASDNSMILILTLSGS